MKYSVVIVDDHTLIAKAIAGIIDNFDNYDVLFEAENGKALIEKMNKTNRVPDIVLLDISMPVMDGFETAKWLLQQHPEVLVLVLSMQDDDYALIKMLKSGAKGYLHKNAHPVELEKALNTLVKNSYYYPEWASGKIFSNIAGSDNNKDLLPFISEREKEFLQYATTELTYKDMAEKMCCSNRTVEGYRNALFEKLGLRTRTGLVVYAIKHGIVKV